MPGATRTQFNDSNILVGSNLLLQRPRELEPIMKSPFLDTKTQIIKILSKERSREGLFKDHVQHRFHSIFVKRSTSEKTREIILESETLSEKKTRSFLKELNKDFDQLSKEEVLEICAQIPPIQDHWTFIVYKRYLISIGSQKRNNQRRNIYLRSKKIELGQNSRVFRLKKIVV